MTADGKRGGLFCGESKCPYPKVNWGGLTVPLCLKRHWDGEATPEPHTGRGE